MNHHVLPPLGLALATGALVPWTLVRARWAQQVPRLALAAWTVCGAVFALAAALIPAQLLLPGRISHRLVDMTLTLTLPSLDRLEHAAGLEYAAVAAALAVLALPVTGFLLEVLRARRARARHAGVLRLAGRYDTGLGATVLDDERPAIYCLPGRSRRVVVSSGAVNALSEAQLAAALRHERAHISGRHHLLVAAARAYATVFSRLPLARLGGESVPLLLEMAADDRALRTSSPEELATALYTLAVGRSPRGAFAASGPSAALRMHRILTPNHAGHPALRGVLALTATAAAITPLVLACCSVPG
ncbi:M56 family metallopeptidase [Streptomyces sp. H27-H1]|uniref:M56 family metallopeptidase n=1 Tax=Streptomyces sp. H27-H1 TaxID=2996461 RepID=UPI00226E4CFD|nr:M56 family metallopeptidase [Streptomyces sp. H27-H1]MCY0928843.1 M56 family metallopeptidase [Streptomyces sp. H27-H1]